MKRIVKLGLVLGAAVLLGFTGCTVEVNNTGAQNAPAQTSDPTTTTESFTVTFETNGGTSVVSQSVESGGTASSPAAPVKNGYSFVGWRTDSALTTAYNFASPVTQNLKLYAEWNVKINGTVCEKTSEVDVITSSTTISCASNTNNYAGVFFENRNVTLSPFSMGKYEVTQDLYKTVMDGVSINGSALASEPSYCEATGTYPLVAGETQKYRPAEGVTWYDAVYFCNALTEKTLGAAYKVYTITNITVSSGHITSATVTMDRTKTGYRLPTEAEWEFAARGGDTSEPDWNYTFSGHATADGVSYSASKNAGLDSVGWYWYNTGNGGVTGDSESSSGMAGYGTHEVGKKARNRLGLYDMSGNVLEWCWDCRGPVGEGNVTDPTGPSSGSNRVLRGGGWFNYADYGSVCNRDYYGPDNRSSGGLGFRVVRSRS